MKVCLVTGGGKGIGAEIAAALSKDGYAVIINYNTSKDAAEKLAASLDNAVAVQADISDRRQAFSLVEQGIKAFGKIDLAVNNAGIARQKLFCDITEQEFDKMLSVNIKGVFNVCQAVIPLMIQKKQGKIINIASMWGEVGASCEVDYSMTKAAVIGLTKALAKELGPSNITVNCVSPGVVMTDMCAGLSSDALDALRDETPLMRLGTPRDIAAAVSFLASDRANFITGQVLGVNGGLVI